jgi:lantibiotic modifying enzyme
MMTEHSEIIKLEFNKLGCKTIVYNPKELYIDKIYFDKFRNFIFSRYKINYTNYDINYPEVLLIKRDDRVNLISDPFLKKNKY